MHDALSMRVDVQGAGTNEADACNAKVISQFQRKIRRSRLGEHDGATDFRRLEHDFGGETAAEGDDVAFGRDAMLEAMAEQFVQRVVAADVHAGGDEPCFRMKQGSVMNAAGRTKRVGAALAAHA